MKKTNRNHYIVDCIQQIKMLFNYLSITVTAILLYLPWQVVCTCEKPIELGNHVSMMACEDMLFKEDDCKNKTVFSVGTSLSKGYKDLLGEKYFEADLVTECVTGPLRLYRRVNHLMVNLRLPKSVSEEFVERGRENYPTEECSWNFFSQSIITSKKTVLVREMLRGKLHPFTNRVEVGDELCRVKKAEISALEQDKMTAICRYSIWESEKDVSKILDSVVRTSNLDVCINNGHLIEEDSGIVLGKGSYCLIEVAGQSMILTSDHLIIKPMSSWGIADLKECREKDQIEVVDIQTLNSEKRDEERVTRKDNEHLCKILSSCDGCNMTGLISKLNSLEENKPGKFLNISLMQNKVLLQRCYHDNLDNRNDLKKMKLDRHSITLDAVDLYIEKLSNDLANSIQPEDGDSIIPDEIVSKDGLSWLLISVISLILLYLTSICCYHIKTVSKQNQKYAGRQKIMMSDLESHI
ncbi:hypothetical protein 3 [Soybean thrips rhabdo-like virus 2]|uniref:Glycoprotein n=1 Tax=Soybean thrips rhabdo-like virus 2 TaxID=2802236 RepID=A0A7T8G235_9RHAB|nr:hypothetical protein 3 [Soybean thrips rhabdo-like virus 2]